MKTMKTIEIDIEVTASRQENDKIEASVSENRATHWGVYYRDKEGLACWIADFTSRDDAEECASAIQVMIEHFAN